MRLAIKEQMTCADLYDHILAVGVGATVLAAMLVAIAVAIPLHAQEDRVPLPRPRPPAIPSEPQSLSPAVPLQQWLRPPETTFEERMSGVDSIPVQTISYRAGLVLPEAVPLPSPRPADAPGGALGGRAWLRAGQESASPQVPILREKALCREHQMRTVWVSKWSWRCRH